ncbi:hypothetical protein F511_29162 [Dorcoceras hygrometricum]|uniref:Uncharacterized protein n=1 Tax=Dorcoceras hygrometricum TaxID=472368 RepID=A0A2Z7CVB9_9LAMI|nr:hypothetical protein F511_29162 [Dorcoceras hygrometricum]
MDFELVDSVNEEETKDENAQSVEAKIDKDEAMSLEELILSIPANIPLHSASIEITKIKMDLLVKLREQIIEEVDRFFHTFSFKKLASINVEEMSQKEDLVLSWGETESIHEALSRKRQLHTQIAASTIDQIDMQREVKELNAKVDAIALNLELVKRDAEVTKEAILHQLLEFQSQAQANHIILTTQLGQLVEDLNRGGNDKKGEGVSSRGPQPTRARAPVRVERRPLPTREPSPDAQSSGQYLSAEQAAEFVVYPLEFSSWSFGIKFSSWGIRWKSADGMQSVVGLFSEIFRRYFPCELSADKSAEAFFREISKALFQQMFSLREESAGSYSFL